MRPDPGVIGTFMTTWLAEGKSDNQPGVWNTEVDLGRSQKQGGGAAPWLRVSFRIIQVSF